MQGFLAAFISLRIFLAPVLVIHDVSLTPGCLCTKADADFDELRYPEQIPHCHRNVKASIEKVVASIYGIDIRDKKFYEFDHYIPLALGGSNAACNIWPQRLDEAHQKDLIETKLYYLLKTGKVTQENAIAVIRHWKSALKNLSQ